MLKIGVTGGIGSGKSVVCRIFETLEIPVYYADLRARKLIEQDKRIIEGYKKLFGEKAYIGGHLNRDYVAGRIFADRFLLQQTNELVHPIVRKDFLHWLNHQKSPYIVQEAAILLESGGYKLMDKIILVSAPEPLRISRVVARDGTGYSKVKERISNQWTDKERRPYCDYEIVADDKKLVFPQVFNIHRELIK